MYLHGMIYFNRLVHLDGTRRAFYVAYEKCNYLDDLKQ